MIESVHENLRQVQQLSPPPAPYEAVFCFPLEPNIPEGPEYEKIYQHYIDARGILETPSICLF